MRRRAESGHDRTVERILDFRELWPHQRRLLRPVDANFSRSRCRRTGLDVKLDPR